MNQGNPQENSNMINALSLAVVMGEAGAIIGIGAGFLLASLLEWSGLNGPLQSNSLLFAALGSVLGAATGIRVAREYLEPIFGI